MNTLAVEGKLRPVNPATLEPVGAVPVTDGRRARSSRRAAAAQERRGRGRRSTSGARCSSAWREVLVARMDEIAATITAETGKPIVEAYTTELMLGVEQVAWLAKNVERVLAPERIRYGIPYLAHKRARVVYEPLGVVARHHAVELSVLDPADARSRGAVAAGNAVVLKPSELTPLSGEWVARVFAEAGAPPGLVERRAGSGRDRAPRSCEAPGHREGRLHRARSRRDGASPPPRPSCCGR